MTGWWCENYQSSRHQRYQCTVPVWVRAAQTRDRSVYVHPVLYSVAKHMTRKLAQKIDQINVPQTISGSASADGTSFRRTLDNDNLTLYISTTLWDVSSLITNHSPTALRWIFLFECCIITCVDALWLWEYYVILCTYFYVCSVVEASLIDWYLTTSACMVGPTRIRKRRQLGVDYRTIISFISSLRFLPKFSIRRSNSPLSVVMRALSV